MRTQKRHRSALIALLVIASLVALTAGSRDVVQAQAPTPSSDPVFAALLDAGMIEPLGHVRDVDEIAITLDWVYVDTSVLTVHLTLTGLPPQPTDPSAARIMPVIELRDTQGNIFLQSGGGSGFDEADPTTLNVETQFSTQYLSATNVENDYFTAIYGDDLPERVALTVAVTLVEQALGAPSASANPDSAQDSLAAVEFPVDVPVYRASTVQPGQSVTANNLTVTLESITSTPAETTLLLCYDLPDGGDWHPVVTLTADGQESLLRGTRLTTLPDPSQVERCEEQSFGIALTEGADALTVNVAALRTSIPDTREYWEAVRDALLKHGIVIEVVMSGGRYFDLISKPDAMDDMTFGTTLYEVQQSQLPTVAGPWTFEVALP